MGTKTLAMVVTSLSIMGCADDGEFETRVDREQALGRVTLSPMERLGKALYFDANLSKHRNQSCATCHDPAVGYTGGQDSAAQELNSLGAVYPGSDPELFGNRKPPSAAYAGDSPPLARRGLAGWVGGTFWDGRATGWDLGDPLAEQAKGPFLNPLEMALASPDELRARVREATYAALFDEVWGSGALAGDVQQVYDRIGIAVAAYERSLEVSSYSSRFDAFWDRASARRLDVARINPGNYTQYKRLGLSDSELYGLAAFNDSNGANCSSCHSLTPGSRGYPLFTDHSYRNIGVPRNPQNPFYDNLEFNPEGPAWVDTGLGGFLAAADPGSAPAARGQMKVPTLRNIDKRPTTSFVRAYGHNGCFKSLAEVVRFYHCRAMGGGMGGPRGGMGGGMEGRMGGGMGCMNLPAPEVGENLAPLGMFPGRDEPYLVAFLKTLSDN